MKQQGESSSEVVRGRLEQVRVVQRRRCKHTNARMTSKQIKEHCRLDEECQELLKMAMTELNLSVRAYDRIPKVSRTIFDLDVFESIQSQHISEAIQYRSLDRQLWV